ncbi:hypothetical protein BH11PAT2_BH11PAT2_09780 [soil metagenome]
MNRVLWHFRARDEEPTLHDVVDLLEEVLIQGEKQKERTLKLHERINQMSYDMNRRYLRQDKENMKFSEVFPT